MRKHKIVGLKTATQDEIVDLIKYWQGKGYTVVHKTTGLAYNGVLIIT